MIRFSIVSFIRKLRTKRWRQRLPPRLTLSVLLNEIGAIWAVRLQSSVDQIKAVEFLAPSATNVWHPRFVSSIAGASHRCGSGLTSGACPDIAFHAVRFGLEAEQGGRGNGLSLGFSDSLSHGFTWLVVREAAPHLEQYPNEFPHASASDRAPISRIRLVGVGRLSISARASRGKSSPRSPPTILPIDLHEAFEPIGSG